ncbi:hypothetical protein EBE87_12750 [Pseudoroseomonas wenyumeiae]|uniref:Quinol:cytochrome c oxidoreductase quinone-binding subunit 2 n=4 Tax=Teichococcus wenyumeiae TaxID=2478470 RepID=A0ABX9VKA5_9PROT|nr:hypothetical protein EBE87_12750 [Pseudoroseomonas wenyumeiae]
MPPPRRAGLCGAAASLLLLLGWALLLPGGGRDAVAGWLVGLVFWLGLSLGAMALLALHALTGGRWGDALRPVLAPAVSGLPLFLPLAVPLLAGAGALYPWTGGAAALPADLVHLYLNRPGFALRGAVALCGWALAGFLLLRLRPGGRREAAAALALVFHLAATTMLGFDWMQSLQASFSSTAFGLQWLLLQVLAALAWACLLRPAGRGATGDIAGLLMATCLAALYLGFVQFLVVWYGNLPGKVAWYLPRQASGWVWLGALSLLLAGLLPALALLAGPVRRSPAALAGLGGCILAGLGAHWVWIVAPALGAAAAVAALPGLLAVGGLWLGGASLLAARQPASAVP